jgi:2-polyprenyl-6-methoxyphenol hydroxylase-like FAD-dependent oxidoreductase
MPRPHVLIAGASIAGPALAFWLVRYGWDVTVVERAPGFRDGGQNVDVRGAGREVLRRAALERTVRDATTGERGTRFVGDDGRTIADFPVVASDTDGATAEVEVLRGDLARILVDATQDATEYVWGDRITGLEDDGDGVDVTFEHGAGRRFDLVVAADGIGSSTRALAFGDEVRIRSLGLDMTYLTIPRTGDDVDWWRWYSAIGGRGVTLRPDRHGTTRAVLTEVTKDRATRPAGAGRGAGRRTPEQQVQHLRGRFEDVGWEAPRVLAALGDPARGDAYVESIGQVLAPRWSSGRVAITGDAAWCASPVSGMGTTLSLVGAYVLAGELAAHVDHRDAFRGYERVMRPYVDRAQHLPPGVPLVANPVTRAGVTAFRLVLRLAASRAAAVARTRFFSPPADGFALPDYAHLETGARR